MQKIEVAAKTEETDEEVATRYRRLKKEATEAFEELTRRGYRVYTVAPDRTQVHNVYGHEVTISKKITKEL